MEHYTNTTQPDHQIATTAAFTALECAAEAVQHAPDQRIDTTQKARTRALGHVAQAHLAFEPTEVAAGLALYVTPQQAHDVAQAALFFTGTAHFDTIQVRQQASADTLLAATALQTLHLEAS